MRVPSGVVVLASGTLLIGAPAAAACSPQDYMSPEEWQALSPQQRAENVAHLHDAGSPATPGPTDGADTAPASPPADPPADPAAGAPDPAPAVDTESGERAGGELVRRRDQGARVVRDRSDAAIGERREREPAPRGQSPASRPVPVVEAVASAPSAAPVVAEPAEAAVRDAATRRADRADRRARRTAAEARERRAASERAADRPSIIDQGARDGRIAPPDVQATDGAAAEAGTPWGVLVAAVIAIATGASLVMRRRRGGGSPEPARPAPGVGPLDPVEAELQELLAEERARAALAPAAGRDQVTRAGEGSSTATNSA